MSAVKLTASSSSIQFEQVQGGHQFKTLKPNEDPYKPNHTGWQIRVFELLR